MSSDSDSFKISSFLTIFVPLALVFVLIGYGAAVQQKRTYLAEIELRESKIIETEKRFFEATMISYLSDAVILADFFKTEFSLLGDTDEVIRELTRAIYTYVQNHRIYDQVRFIDKNGREKIRINWKEGTGAKIVPESGLQNKSDRKYFIKGMAQGKTPFMCPGSI